MSAGVGLTLFVLLLAGIVLVIARVSSRDDARRKRLREERRARWGAGDGSIGSAGATGDASADSGGCGAGCGGGGCGGGGCGGGGGGGS